MISLFTSKPARIGLPLVIFILGLAITASRVHTQQTTFTASARIWIPTRIFTLSKDLEPAGAQGDSALTAGPNALRTACEIIHSDAVTKLAYEELQKKLGDKCPPASMIQGGLRAKPVESTDILDLGFSAADSDIAVTVLQSCIDAFFRENNIQVTEPMAERKTRLEQQLKVAQQQYSKVKNQVKQFQDSSSFIDMQADVQTLTQQKQDLEKTLEENKHELSAVKSRLDYAQKQLGFGPESVVAVQKLADDEIMRSLRSHIAETEVQLIGLRSKYQDEHPKVKRLKASLEEAKKGLDARYMTIVGKPGLKDVIVGNGSMSSVSSTSGTESGASTGASKGLGGGVSESAQARMIGEMAESSTAIASLNAKIASLSASLGAVRSKLSSVPARQMELADIHRADELATNSLTSIERELQKIHLSESADSSSSSMQVIDAPSITGTSAPNIWFMGIGLSAFFAGLLAAGQFLLLPKFVSANKLVALVHDLPAAGVIPLVPQSRGTSSSLIASVDRIRLSLTDWFESSDIVPVVVTSADKGDGKTMTAYALANCLADCGRNVLLIDADTKAPTIHRLTSISASPGLLQYLDEPTIDSFEVMQAVRDNLTVIPAGGILDNQSCFKEPRFKRLIADSVKNFDAIIIDSPECGDSLDSLVVPQFKCRLLALVRLQSTLTSSLQNLATQMHLLPSIESRLVVNGVAQKDIARLRSGLDLTGKGSQIASNSDAIDVTSSASESEAVAW